MLQPFTWNGNTGQKLTPGQVKVLREMAAASANKPTPKNLGEGLASVGDALVYNSNMARAGEAESAGIAQVQQALAEARASGSSDSFLDVMGNEWATPGQQLIAGELYKRSQPDWQTFERGGDILRWNANDPNSTPDTWYDGPEAPPAAPEVETFYDEETGRNVKKQWGANGWETVGGVEAPGSSLVTVNTGEGSDSALDKALSTKEGESWAAIKDAGMVAGAMSGDLGLLDELIKVAPQGPLIGPMAETFKGFSSAGDAFQSIVKRVAPSLRTPGSGATSDIEYQGFLDSLPALKNSPEGNLLINAIMKSKAAINKERADIVTAYQNGDINPATGLPMSIGDARRAMAELNSRSIITPEMRQALAGVGAGDVEGPPQVGTIVDGYVFQGGDPANPSSWKKQ